MSKGPGRPCSLQRYERLQGNHPRKLTGHLRVDSRIFPLAAVHSNGRQKPNSGGIDGEKDRRHWSATPHFPSIGKNRNGPIQHTLLIAAAIGFNLHISVLVSGFLITCHFSWEKDGQVPDPSVCYVTAVGTALLCTGMFICDT